MSKNPAPDRTHHRTFCITEGWTVAEDARGRAVSHHETYELVTPDGRILRTRISNPVNRTTYSASMWAHILRDQLLVDDSEFWACVSAGKVPDRGGRVEPAEGIPVSLVYQLLNVVGLTEQEVSVLTKEEAVKKMNDHWSKPHGTAG